MAGDLNLSIINYYLKLKEFGAFYVIIERPCINNNTLNLEYIGQFDVRFLRPLALCCLYAIRRCFVRLCCHLRGETRVKK